MIYIPPTGGPPQVNPGDLTYGDRRRLKQQRGGRGTRRGRGAAKVPAVRRKGGGRGQG